MERGSEILELERYLVSRNLHLVMHAQVCPDKCSKHSSTQPEATA